VGRETVIRQKICRLKLDVLPTGLWQLRGHLKRKEGNAVPIARRRIDYEIQFDKIFEI